MAARLIASVSLVVSGLVLGSSAMAQKDEPNGVEQVAAATPEFSPREDKSAQDRAEFRTLDEDVQGLKKQVLDLNRDLFLLEEELLFPSNTQTAVFVAMDVGEFFGLDSVELKIDNKSVANYLYTEREASALVKGGVQRLYIGNLKAGDHELVAVFTGGGPHTRDYRRATSVTFEKGIGPKYIELTISDKATKLQPEFVVKEWE
ncbi:MAG: AraC family transcriptional regulator [Gammaproteobacteria bacterium]